MGILSRPARQESRIASPELRGTASPNYKGKKTYITAAIGLLSAVAAWADGWIDGVALRAATWAAAQACFVRAWILRASPTAQE